MKQEYFVSVQQGFRILVSSLAGYIGKELRKTYKDRWWDEVLLSLDYQRDLPMSGTYDELVNSLDIANCIRIIDIKWNDVFSYRLSKTCRSYAKELMGVRNIVSHLGQQDLEQAMAERALDTMALLCKEIDPEGEKEIREIYRDVRAQADGAVPVFVGLPQPESESRRGALTEGSLLQLIDTDVVKKTTLTRKVTYGGKTVIYPVYRVRLDALYYNDQNDRIATWISRYQAENGEDSLEDLNIEIYNRIIENFIVESNSDAIQKTQNNIELVGQREPGVTLADGRVVDGNRRFTCLRRIQRDKNEPEYFETVIMDMDIREDKKQIKLLELAIQHGEEKKVDYDLIDYAIGTYRDVVQTKLLTTEEYAESTNEPVSEVRKRIEIAQVICEFLDYIRLHDQFHVARDLQVYSLFQEMMSPLRQLGPEKKEELKKIAFNNALMRAIPDQRKFIRDIKGMVKNNTYDEYFDEQMEISERISERFSKAEIHTGEDVERFVSENGDISEELRFSMEKALQRSRSQILKSRPADNVEKSIALLTEIDSRLFVQMDREDRETLNEGLSYLAKIIENFRKQLNG